MKKLFPVVLLLLLTGCAGFNKSIFDGGLSITATVQNPVTNEMQAGVETSVTIARKAILAYARQPRCVGPVLPTCSSWPVIQKLQAGNRIAERELQNMRNFMDTNQQVSAVTAYNGAVKALRGLRATAYVEGIEIKETP